MRVLDVLDNTVWIPRLLNLIDEIQEHPHENNANYEQFVSRLFDYECFTILLDDNDEILAMSGVMHFGDGLYRVLDRTYYFDWHKRKFNGNTQDDLRYSAEYLLPFQMEFVKNIKAKAAFISIQNPKKRRAFEKVLKHKNYNNFTLLSGLYNTVNSGGENRPNHWQNIALWKIDPDYNFDLPHKSIHQYHNHFDNKKEILKAYARQRKLHPDSIYLGSVSDDWVNNALIEFENTKDSTQILLNRRADNKVLTSGGQVIELDGLNWGEDYRQRMTNNIDLPKILNKYSHVRFAELEPNKTVPPHLDDPWTYRFIIVLQGSHNFITENSKTRMCSGDVYYVNGCIKHSIENCSDVTRIAILGNFEINEITTELLRAKARG